MSHTTVNTEEESGGSMKTVVHTIDIDSLDNEGSEDYDPQDEVSLDGKSVTVAGQGDATYNIAFDHVDGGQLLIVNVDDGSDVSAETDVGEVRLRVDGE